MTKSIVGLVPGGLAKTAAINAGLPPTTGVSALIRAAIAMFLTGSQEQAYRYLNPKQNVKTVGSLPFNENVTIAGYVPEFEDDLKDVPNRAAAIRTGLAMLAGWDKETAESQAFVPRRGRPWPAKSEPASTT